MRMLTEADEAAAARFGRRRFAAMALATLIAPGTLATEQLAGLELTVWPVVIGSVTMFLLVVARMSMTIRHINLAHEQREILREELVYQAAHDSLTRLPNRAQAMRLLTGALHRAQRSGSIIGVLFVDLDGFKAINDTHGHLAGDELLRMVARTLQDQVRAGDVVARLGGDEFVVVLEPVDVQSSAVLVADRLVESLHAPFVLSGGQEVRIGASIGLAISQDGRVEAEGLLQEADVAVYRAKAGGRGRTEVFDDVLRAELAARTELEAAIARAIREDQFVVYYQPVVEVAVRTGRRVRGAGALEPSRTRAVASGRVHPGGRDVGSHLRSGRVGASARDAPARGMERPARTATREYRGQRSPAGTSPAGGSCTMSGQRWRSRGSIRASSSWR